MAGGCPSSSLVEPFARWTGGSTVLKLPHPLDSAVVPFAESDSYRGFASAMP